MANEWKGVPMHNPYLLAALAEDRRRQCPCGAMAERSFGLCRKCQARGAWRRRTTSRRRQAVRRLTGRRIRGIARLLAEAMPLLPTLTTGMGI